MTSWFREYLYFPLGGNRKGPLRTYLNQWIVFLLSGFWHGASWNFIVWGAYNGTLLCIERMIFGKRKIPILSAFLKWGGTFFLVIIGWVFFRADNLKLAFSYIGNLFDFSSYFVHVPPEYILTIDLYGWLAFILAVGISFCRIKKTCRMPNIQYIRDIGVLLLFYISALKIITGSISPFIYFRF